MSKPFDRSGSLPLKMLLIIFLLGVSTLASAQGDIWVGFKGGLNFANLQTGNAQSVYQSRRGPQMGLLGTYRKGKNAIQAEIIYSIHYNVRTFTPSLAPAFYFDDRFSYLNFPVMFKRYFGPGFNLQAGPQMGFLVQSNVIQSYDAYGNVTSGPSTSVNKSNLSFSLGAGWDFPVGFLIDIRYNIGLTDTNTNSASWTARNRVVQISIGWKFKMKKKEVVEKS